MTEKFIIHQSSSYTGAPWHDGEVLVKGSWYPARLEGTLVSDGVRQALCPWSGHGIDAVRINGTIYIDNMAGKSQA